MRRRSLAGRRAVCINNSGVRAYLILGKKYQVIGDSDAEARNLFRIRDESGKDCLYPACRFRLIPKFKPLTGKQKIEVQEAAKSADWLDSRPAKPVHRPEGGDFHKDGKCWSTCWHCFWGIDYDEDGTITGLQVIQAKSAREARDKAYHLAAKLLNVGPYGMRDEYDFRGGKPNPYAKRLRDRDNDLNFVPEAAKELAKRGFRRINNPNKRKLVFNCKPYCGTCNSFHTSLQPHKKWRRKWTEAETSLWVKNHIS